jgi:hypothetical protein
MEKDDVIERAALALEKYKMRQYGWSKKEFEIWCYSDTRGIKSFAESKKEATIVYNSLSKNNLK